MPNPIGSPCPVSVVEDDAGFREGLAWLIASCPDFECRRQFGSAEEALLSWTADPPHPDEIVCLDLSLPGMDGLFCLKHIRTHWPRTRVVILSMHEDADTILSALRAGADGYLVKSTTPLAMLEALREVCRGGSPLSGLAARYVLHTLQTRPEQPCRAFDLSPREMDILTGLVEGLTYKGLATRYGIRIDTVRSHIKRLYEKMAVHSRHEAVALAHRHGLFPTVHTS